MSNQDVLKEITANIRRRYVPFDHLTFFEVQVPQDVVYHHNIEGGEGIICVLKERSNNRQMKNAERIDKEILVEVTQNPTLWCIPIISNATGRNIYDLKEGDYLRLLIKKVTHSRPH